MFKKNRIQKGKLYYEVSLSNEVFRVIFIKDLTNFLIINVQKPENSEEIVNINPQHKYFDIWVTYLNFEKDIYEITALQLLTFPHYEVRTLAKTLLNETN